MKRPFILILLILMFSFLNLPYKSNNITRAYNANNNVELYPIKQNGKWGYINKLGQIVIEPKFSMALPFSDGLAFVKTTKSFNFRVIDSNGNIVLKLPLEVNIPNKNSGYSEDLAPVSVNGKYGFINTNGEVVINFQYDFAEAFSDGLALVKKDGKYGFIDKEGKSVIEPHFVSATAFSEGLAGVYLQKTDKYPLFINKKGEAIFYLPNQVTKSFIKKSISENNIFDSSFKNLINNSSLTSTFNAVVSFDRLAFSEDLVSVRVNNQYGYMNKDGKIEIEPQFAYADAFSEGFAQVSIKGNCAFINKSGQVVIHTPYDYYSCSCFSNGLAKIQVAGQIGYIDKSGQFIWPLID